MRIYITKVTPQQHHGVGSKPVEDNHWRTIKTSDAWLRKPILVTSFRAKVYDIMIRLKDKCGRAA